MITRSLLCAVAVALPLLVPGSAVAQESTEPTPPPTTSTTAPPTSTTVPPTTTVTIPPSTTTAPPSTTTVTTTPSTTPSAEPVRGSCAAYARAGVYDIPATDPRYRADLDRDRDNIACERGRDDLPGAGRGPVIIDGDCRLRTERRDAEKVALREVIRRINADHDRYRARSGRLNDGEARELRGLYGDYDRRASDWRRLDTDRRLICRDERPDVIEVRINDAPPVVRETVPCACTAPSSSSGGQVYATPRGAAETGGL